jgi:hypothetical protein
MATPPPNRLAQLVERRISHGLDLHRHHDGLLRVTGFVDPNMETWLTALSRVPTLLIARP